MKNLKIEDKISDPYKIYLMHLKFRLTYLLFMKYLRNIISIEYTKNFWIHPDFGEKTEHSNIR